MSNSIDFHWVELIMIEPFAVGYSPVAPGFKQAVTAGSIDTAEDIERRSLHAAFEIMKVDRPDLFVVYEAWRRSKDRATMGDVFAWLEETIDRLLGSPTT